MSNGDTITVRLCDRVAATEPIQLEPKATEKKKIHKTSPQMVDENDGWPESGGCSFEDVNISSCKVAIIIA